MTGIKKQDDFFTQNNLADQFMYIRTYVKSYIFTISEQFTTTPRKPV